MYKASFSIFLINYLKVLTANMDDDESESHAAKLLEIIILQCQQQIDNVREWKERKVKQINNWLF